MRTAFKGLRGIGAAAGIAVLVQGLGTLAIGPAADAEIANVTATTNVNIRTAPTVSSTRLAVLQKGQSLPSQGSSNGWTTVTYQGRTAYVASAYLNGGTAASTPSSTTSNGSTTSSTGTVYTTANLNLRVGPSLSDAVSVVVQRGTALQLAGKVSGAYVQVSHNGKLLWAASQYISATAAAAYGQLPAVTGKGRATAALMIRTTPYTGFVNLGDVPAGTILDTTGVVTNGMAQVVYKGAVRWVNAKYLVAVSASTPAPTAPALPATTVRYATTVLNIWTASSGTSYVGEIPRGGEVRVTGLVTNGRAQAVVNGAVRWVTARYLSTTKPSESTASSGSSTTLNRGYSSGLDQTNANVQAIVRDIWNRYPAIKTMYGWRQDVTPDHPAGRAVDVMIPSYSSNQALGWEIANYYKANASKYNINYIIFAQKIWSVQRSSEGWRLMADRGSDNANHYNHVHINTYG
ncbi:SH3 domain-containing protein [Tessaracoccus sp. MC1679]|uniref:SH3 domain-containing protein n=1 Tax=Tessaracoccus sp. MC1679 TaxID=2760313 RepID=UPI0016047852|nr:SH3 domain-containing protein [Tessaracoccus sp. MC1679]